MTRYVLTGATCGLAWSASLRAWMAELADGASASRSEVTWLTLVLVLLPGAVVGALLGHAAHRRSTQRPGPSWLVLAPVVLASALADPEVFRGLVEDGTGGGSLLVVLTALSTGHVVARPGWTPVRGLLAAVAGLGLLTMFGMGALAAPLLTPRGLWVGLLGVALLVVLGLASALPHAPGRASLALPWWVAGGALGGLTWAAGLRGFMAQVAGNDSGATWAGTFLWVLAPGLVAGSLLGWATYHWWHGGPSWMRGLVASPFVFAAVVLPPLVTLDVGELFEAGVGGGVVGVPAFGIVGAYALTGGRTWLRACAGALFLSAIPVWAATATDIGGDDLSLATPHGMWAALHYWSLLAVLALACAAPLRITPIGARPAKNPTTHVRPTLEEHRW